MTTIQNIIAELETAVHPVARAIHKGEGFKALAIGFKKGMVLKDHKAHVTSKLTVLSGAVIYKEAGQQTVLDQYDEIDIPVQVTHSVEAKEDSLCLLTQG